MSRLQSSLSRRRAARAHLREERALARALAAAPTIESAPEIWHDAELTPGAGTSGARGRSPSARPASGGRG
jgi:hypothetical protein